MTSSFQINLSDIKAAIFDMDGTMVVNMQYHMQAWQEFLRRHGLELSDEEFKQKISGKKNDQIMEIAFGRPINSEELAQFTEEKEQTYRQLYAPVIQEVAGLTDIINEFQARGIKLAIATTAPAKNRDFVLSELQLEGKFEVILGDEHVTKGKPDPEIYQSTAEQLGVKPGDCLVFEDSPPGVAAGHSAGMKVVGLLTSHTADELVGADYTATDFVAIQLN